MTVHLCVEFNHTTSEYNKKEADSQIQGTNTDAENKYRYREQTSGYQWEVGTGSKIGVGD